MKPRTLSLVFPTALFLLALSACGDKDSGNDTPKPDEKPDRVEKPAEKPTATDPADAAVPDFELQGTTWITINRLSDAAAAELEKLKDNPNAEVTLGKVFAQADFENLKRFPWIHRLRIDHGNKAISSFGPIAAFTELQTFASMGVEASKENPFDLAPFAELTELEDVDFYATQVTNTAALAGLDKLRRVSLYMSATDSIGFLENTPAVEDLNLYGFKHTFPDYAPVLKLAALREFDIYMNEQATDEKLAPLAALTTLEVIRMSNSKHATSLGFLTGSKRMREIHANWCPKLTDISAIADFDKIQTVQISKAPISDLAVFAGKAELANLDISETAIADLSPLATCPKLSGLNISDSKATDLSPLEGLTELRNLTVGEDFPDASLDPLKAALPELNVRKR